MFLVGEAVRQHNSMSPFHAFLDSLGDTPEQIELPTGSIKGKPCSHVERRL